MRKLIAIAISPLLFFACSDRSGSSSNRITGDAVTVQSSPLPENHDLTVVSPVIPAGKITVGGKDAIIRGFSSEAIQAAIESLKASGKGGIIELTPGIFNIIAPVRLYSNMKLTGSGAGTILKKCSGISSPFAIDADYGELQVTVADTKGFLPGMGVAVYDDEQRSGWALTTARITEIKGNTLFLDDYLLRDYSAARHGTVSNACSVIEAVNAGNVEITNLAVEGGKETNLMIDGCRAGGIYLHKVRKALVENVSVRNFNSDGISWQITEHVTVRSCEVSGCTNSGLHPGTGSPYTLIENNNSHNNGGYGLFVCWRVRNGVVQRNEFHDNGINGISTGHKDTNMLFSYNHIFNNGEDGITLRGESPNNEPDGTIIRHNVIENNGLKKDGYGISVYSPARGVTVENNTFRNTSGKQLAAIFIGEHGLRPEMKGNELSGMPKGEMVTKK
ncbi:MAG TPA: right-handed parallel beta-helix repeat-containing protein [Bacteroidales bacterium]|nr:right-handed parallel beta-helix repeat-containing protein [Bacteroidales bacterium]